ncbi:MAG TPA: hypothetical protein PLM98_05200 [Thiolinea sp.]|nr:hypothetical protein [Thiolinea sp.]
MNWVSSWGAGLLFGLFLQATLADEQLLLPKSPTIVVTSSNLVSCKEPRPEICYEVYAPVCAVRKVQVQCTLAPCLNIEQKTYANDCQACSDHKVVGFASGGECS